MSKKLHRGLLQKNKAVLSANGPFQPWRQAKTALAFGMITQYEHDEIIKGNMDLDKSVLLNLNSTKTPLKTGEKTMISHGRAEEVMIQKALGLW